MIVKVNGKDHVLQHSLSIRDFLKQCDLDAGKIVIEYNAAILPHEKWAEVVLYDNDRLEIVSFVGGG